MKKKILGVMLCLLVCMPMEVRAYPISGADLVMTKSLVKAPVSGVCRVLAESLVMAEVNAEKMLLEEERAEREKEKIRQRLEEEKKAKEAYEQRLVRIFGYVPTTDAIYRGKCVCMAEGGNTESIIGLERIFEVIANRCRSSRFPNTIDEVIYQRGQFETVSTGRMWKYEMNDKVEEAWENLISRGYCVDDKVLFFTAGGYNPYCIPMYKLDNHYFGR